MYIKRCRIQYCIFLSVKQLRQLLVTKLRKEHKDTLGLQTNTSHIQSIN